MAALAAGAVLSALPPAAAAYRAGPPAGHTGGFGEPTCAACHFQDDDRTHPTALAVDAPDPYRPGSTYDIRVTLTDPEAAAGGFQLTARFADGASAGRQAGTLCAVDSTVRIVGVEAGTEYAGHSPAGTGVRRPGRATWVVRWTAPAVGGDVVFHAAGNAANDDDSEFGDRIHVVERRVRAR